MSVGDRILLAGGAAALLLVALAGWLLLTPAGGAPDDLALVVDPIASVEAAAPAPATPPSELVVDVEGAVVQPGLHRLPPASRIADALMAAGGYSAEADLEAAARELNLAEPLTDGRQIYVPRLGDDAGQPPGSGATAGGGTTGGLVDLNTATPEALDALPGIGPVTVQKIVAARQERPFASLEEAVERGVLNRGQLEEIRELATAG